MNIDEKLMMIQAELKAPKSQYNSFGKYNYRNCEDILEAVKPLCKKYGAHVRVTDELMMIGDRFYVMATAILTDIETAETINTHAYAREEAEKKGMDGSQVTGAASSYARKYALNGLFAIDDTKDSDTTNTHGKEEKPKTSTSFACAECGNTILPYFNNGKEVSVKRHIAGSMDRYGKMLCIDCIKKIQAEEVGAME